MADIEQRMLVYHPDNEAEAQASAEFLGIKIKQSYMVPPGQFILIDLGALDTFTDLTIDEL